MRSWRKDDVVRISPEMCANLNKGPVTGTDAGVLDGHVFNTGDYYTVQRPLVFYEQKEMVLITRASVFGLLVEDKDLIRPRWSEFPRCAGDIEDAFYALSNRYIIRCGNWNALKTPGADDVWFAEVLLWNKKDDTTTCLSGDPHPTRHDAMLAAIKAVEEHEGNSP